jgi:hypothetical protein
VTTHTHAVAYRRWRLVLAIAYVCSLLLLTFVTYRVTVRPQRNCVTINRDRVAIVSFITRTTAPSLKQASPAERRLILAYLADARRTFAPLDCKVQVLP